MKLTASDVRRPKTNLVVDPRFQLDRERMKTGFMGVFNWAYTGDARKTLLKLAIGAVMPAAGIPLGKIRAPKTPEERAERKSLLTRLRAFEKTRLEMHLGQFTKLKKVVSSDPHFVLQLPVLHLRDVQDMDRVLSIFSGAVMEDAIRTEMEDLFGGATQTFPAREALHRSGLAGPTQEIFRTTLLSVTYEAHNGFIVYLNFKILPDEAQALVSADWMEIRPVDLYPLFNMWVDAEFVSRSYSKSVVSLSRIAATLPKHDPNDERVDENGIGIDLSGDAIWLPRECNNTQKYESMFASASAVPGDTFSLRNAANPDAAPHLPANIPILVDWVNNKFTYSNSSGKPVIMDLSHVRRCTASAAVNLLRRPVPDRVFERWAHYASAVNLSIDMDAYGGTSGVEVPDYAEEAAKQQGEGFYTRYLDLTSDTEYAAFLPLSRFVVTLFQKMTQNIEALNAQYAVSTMTDVMGILAVLSTYGQNMSKTRVAATTARKAAATQGVNPNWQPEEMPLITAKFGTDEGGMLPHQAKIRNILKDSPEHAILSVDAGGGKSMLSITDILYEIKANRSHPYLIMCPSHLVANYVAELVEFTDGQMNVIPVTSFNIRTSGIPRYEEILKAAPINTVLVVDYDVLKYRSKAMGYGTSAVPVYPVIEMIRQFKPGYVMMDESHFLRNMKSARTRSVMNLVADIPKKRLASGTLNPDSPSDLAGQMAILDPSIFGSRENFNQTYGEDLRGDRVMKWRTKGPNSISEVLPRLKETVVWAQAKRKEWACALPQRKDEIMAVDLTPGQRQMYDILFDDMIQSIRKDAEKNKSAKKLLEKLVGGKASKQDEDDFSDLGDEEGGDEGDDLLDDVEDVGPALQPYLADIERFVTDPTSHPYSKNGVILPSGERVPPLTGDDLKPPKARALEHLLKDYLGKHKAKVIVFVNYNQSAESLFNAMPAELKAQGMLYSASEKTELVNRFKKDDSIRWMIGIRKSLEVGLNLQVAGCLIRMEGVWNPGEQEQGDSRIARPYFGPGGDSRDILKFYTIIADRTIDVTKTARLRAKIVALAKFENTGNPNYEAIEDIPIIPMNLETILTQNDFATNLAQYQTSMAHLNQVIKDENEEYRKQIIDDGGFHFTQVQKSVAPAGAALLSRVPYAQGTELYKASELGLVRVDNYLGLELGGEEEEEEGGDEEEVDNDLVAQQRELLMGKRVHTEFGDGIVVGCAAAGVAYINRLSVRLDDGTTVQRLRSTNAFIVTRTETNSVDMRNKLAQAAGMDVTGKITVPGVFVKQTKLTQKEIREMERKRELENRKLQKDARKLNQKISVELQLQVVNGYLRFSYSGKDTRTAKALESLGFKMDQPHYYARIRSARHLLRQVTAWAESGFQTTNQVDNDAMQMLTNELTKSGLSSHKHYARLVGGGNFGNYLRTIWKPTADKKALNMFALITDGGEFNSSVVRQAEKQGTEVPYSVAYLCLPAGSGHPGSVQAISAKYKVPGVVWYESTPTLSIFVGSMNSAIHIFKRLQAAGITITNGAELNEMARSVKRVQIKVDQHVDVTDDMLEDDEEEAPKSKRKVKEVKPTKKVVVKPKAPVKKPARR